MKLGIIKGRGLITDARARGNEGGSILEEQGREGKSALYCCLFIAPIHDYLGIFKFAFQECFSKFMMPKIGA